MLHGNELLLDITQKEECDGADHAWRMQDEPIREKMTRCASSAGAEICDCAEVGNDYKLYKYGMYKKDKNNHCGM
jgi:hypothetical protein